MAHSILNLERQKVVPCFSATPIGRMFQIGASFLCCTGQIRKRKAFPECRFRLGVAFHDALIMVENGSGGCVRILSPRSLNHPSVFPLPTLGSQGYHICPEHPRSSSTTAPGAGSFIALHPEHIINRQISPYKRFLTLAGNSNTTQTKKRSQSKEKAEATAPALSNVLYVQATNL